MHAFSFYNPNYATLWRHIAASSRLGLPLAAREAWQDVPGVLVCAPGPGLTQPPRLEEIRQRVEAGWKVLAIKAAIRVLQRERVPVAFSCAIDPDRSQAGKTPADPTVLYFVASSCHPDLFAHLRGKGCPVVVFHSATGWQGRSTAADGTERDIDEVVLYERLFGGADVIGGGHTVASRAFELAKYLGARRVALAGTAFGWGKEGRCHAKGVRGKASNIGAAVEVVCPDRTWWSRPDMIGSALHVAQALREGRVEVLGNSLAVSLASMPDARLARAFPECRHGGGCLRS